MADPDRKLHVAVTGLNATDNPGPGVAVIRSLRDSSLDLRIVGLAYDTLEPGIYAPGMVDDVFLIPYPSQGLDTLRERLAYIHERVRLDAVMPTLDSELRSFMALSDWLDEQGIASFLPASEEELGATAKSRLPALGERIGLEVPRTHVINDADELLDLHLETPFPYVVKGVFYGAKVVHTSAEAVEAYHSTLARWGAPVLVQALAEGDEYCVLGLGDGAGGLVGAVPMRKTFLTDKGKGWAGVTFRDPRLTEAAERFARETSWRGPFELEMRRGVNDEPKLLEINPRFPAWTYLAAGAGANLPEAALRLALGESPPDLRDYRVGAMFIRIALDQMVSLEDFAAMTQTGELSRPLNQGA